MGVILRVHEVPSGIPAKHHGHITRIFAAGENPNPILTCGFTTRDTLFPGL
ncbi:hypothetical protein HMPREF0578_0679 [Mobiluncus mulieris 28-1]|nr:hypothetical protein HMPREF0578_0679 [Mobiluncus mulieris 28-1]